MSIRRIATLVVALLWSTSCLARLSEPQWSTPRKDSALNFQWGVKIPMRDGVKLNATMYQPLGQRSPLPCIFTLTPYISQTYHDRGMYFASHGYVFLAIDSRGRGNSEGTFTPLLQEAKDGHDVVEWLAKQSYCNGKVAMWGGSYSGYDQWATAKEFPPHLATIIPVASPRPGVDFPGVNNIPYSYDMQWLLTVAGHTLQESILGDDGFWKAQLDEMYLYNRPFRQLDAMVGYSSESFQTWVAHPAVDSYWDSYNPTPQQFAKIDLPILTITGQYDDDQPGALSFYREAFRYGSTAAKAKHYLIIGPWDHFATRTPDAEYGGIEFGKSALIDMNQLIKNWYDWTMKAGPKPEFLKNKVTYYLFGDGIGQWRYARSLEAVTEKKKPMYLSSSGNNADSIFASGVLTANRPQGKNNFDHYIYDPLDTKSTWDPEGDVSENDFLTDASGLIGLSGSRKLLVYQTPPFEHDIDLAGFFKLSAWVSLNQPDTDIAATIYEITPDGHSQMLTLSTMRVRYRHSLRKATFAHPGSIEFYDFDHFRFIARHIAKGSRLRLVIGPMNSRNYEKNYNGNGVVADESAKDARTVTVTLYHNTQYLSALYLPIAAPSEISLNSNPQWAPQ